MNFLFSTTKTKTKKQWDNTLKTWELVWRKIPHLWKRLTAFYKSLTIFANKVSLQVKLLKIDNWIKLWQRLSRTAIFFYRTLLTLDRSSVSIELNFSKFHQEATKKTVTWLNLLVSEPNTYYLIGCIDLGQVKSKILKKQVKEVRIIDSIVTVIKIYIVLLRNYKSLYFLSKRLLSFLTPIVNDI